MSLAFRLAFRLALHYFSSRNCVKKVRVVDEVAQGVEMRIAAV